MDVDKRNCALHCPYDINRIEFSQYSVANSPLQDLNKKYSKQNIIIGGASGTETTFLEVQVSLRNRNHAVEYNLPVPGVVLKLYP